MLYGLDLAAGDRRAAARRRGRGLHRRHGLPPGRRGHRDRHLRHLLRRGAHQDTAPAPGGPEPVPRRQDRLHLRRRLGRPEGRAARVRTRTSVRHADLRGRAARGPGPVRSADGQRRRGRARPGRLPDAAVRVRDPRRAGRARPGHPEGRVQALRRRPVVAGIRDDALRHGYAPPAGRLARAGGAGRAVGGAPAARRRRGPAGGPGLRRPGALRGPWRRPRRPPGESGLEQPARRLRGRQGGFGGGRGGGRDDRGERGGWGGREDRDRGGYGGGRGGGRGGGGGYGRRSRTDCSAPRPRPSPEGAIRWPAPSARR